MSTITKIEQYLGLPVIRIQLEAGEFMADRTAKTGIVVHHTAGGPNAANVISGSWENDRTKTGGKLAVATSFVIGGPMSSNPAMDGQIYMAFPDENWAHHLGTTRANNVQLNRQTIGIEICNWGPITKTKDGKFITYVGSELAPEHVYQLSQPFRGFTWYHEYSDKQIASTRALILALATKWGINPKKVWNRQSFELSDTALTGGAGIWTHTNYRSDKFDISPSPKMIAMLNTL